VLGYPRVFCGAGNPGPLCVVYSLKYAGNPGTLSVRESLFNSIQIIHLEISPECCEEYGLKNMLRHFNFFEIGGGPLLYGPVGSYLQTSDSIWLRKKNGAR
jgi:hypothetical protein